MNIIMLAESPLVPTATEVLTTAGLISLPLVLIMVISTAVRKKRQKGSMDS